MAESGIMIRLMDIVLSLIAIIVLTPFMVPVIIGLKLTGEHDVFYMQERIGRRGKTFVLLKFATMKRNSPNLPGGMFTSENDSRILPMGNFLRKTKINELPQLLNILFGQMSIIGYRPTTKQFYDKYSNSVKQKISTLRPGLSGIGSVVFRNEEDILKTMDDKEEFDEKVITPFKGELEAWYADHASLYIYFKLIFLTIEAVINPKSQKWKTAFDDLPKVPKELEPYL